MILKKLTILSSIILLSASTALEAAHFVEAKAGYFYPTNSRFRKIFSNGGGIYGVELNFETWCGLYVWASGDVFAKSGYSIGEKDQTRIKLIPLAGGLKYFIPCGCMDFYLAGGVVGTYLQTATDSPFMIDRVSKWGVGGIGKLGALWHLYESLFLDTFVNYTYTRISFSNRHIADVSGITAGGALSFCF